VQSLRAAATCRNGAHRPSRAGAGTTVGELPGAHVRAEMALQGVDDGAVAAADRRIALLLSHGGAALGLLLLVVLIVQA
jgi:hypothetical protein